METAENLCLGFGCRGKGLFCKGLGLYFIKSLRCLRILFVCFLLIQIHQPCSGQEVVEELAVGMEQGEAPRQDEPNERGTECAFRRDIKQMAQSGIGKQGNKDNKNACPNKAQAQLWQGRLGIVFIG